MAVQEKRLRILEKMGLFDFWDKTAGNKKVVKWLTKTEFRDPIQSLVELGL